MQEEANAFLLPPRPIMPFSLISFFLARFIYKKHNNLQDSFPRRLLMKRPLPAEAYQFAEMYRLGKPTITHTINVRSLIAALWFSITMCLLSLFVRYPLYF